MFESRPTPVVAEPAGRPRPVRNPLVVAVDTSDLERAEALADRLAGVVAYLKVGLELFTAGGPAIVERVRAHAPVFLDLKLHDIPATVGRAVKEAGKLGVHSLTVHSSGARASVCSPPRIWASFSSHR